MRFDSERRAFKELVEKYELARAEFEVDMKLLRLELDTQSELATEVQNSDPEAMEKLKAQLKMALNAVKDLNETSVHEVEINALSKKATTSRA